MSSQATRLGLAGAALALALLAPRMAAAVYQCGDQKDDCQCGANDPYPCCANGGNCTWWAWESACCNWGAALPGWGNANQWGGNAKLDPNYDVLASPVVGSIANRVSGTYGHVAWVTAVNGSSIDVTEENCCGACNYGMRSWTYQASYFDGGFIVRKAQCECAPGQSQEQGCGNCGKQTRTCGADCKWGGWAGCGGEGACAGGQMDEQACGDCGKHSRTCDGSCMWGDFGACAGPDPGGGADPCDTGKKGVCAAGTKKCVDGTVACQATAKASPEVCDTLDNDCDGLTDEDGVCGVVGEPPLPGVDAGGPIGAAAGAGGAAGTPLDSPDAGIASGCSCGTAQGRSSWTWLGLLALGGLLRARARRRRA